LYATSDKNTTDTAAFQPHQTAGSSTRPGGGPATLAEIFEELDLSEEVGGKRRSQVSRQLLLQGCKDPAMRKKMSLKKILQPKK